MVREIHCIWYKKDGWIEQRKLTATKTQINVPHYNTSQITHPKRMKAWAELILAPFYLSADTHLYRYLVTIWQQPDRVSKSWASDHKSNII